jgi:hypothetical protein
MVWTVSFGGARSPIVADVIFYLMHPYGGAVTSFPVKGLSPGSYDLGAYRCRL